MNEAEKLINSLYGKGTIGFTCDSCGRETNGITYVNGMKFCAKCYQETFGKDNQQNEIQQLKQELPEKDKLIYELEKEAERLTRNNKVNYYFHDEASNIVYYKLQKLEDIMEKYGIEDLEQYLLKMRKVDKELRDTIQQLHTIIDSIGYDRDTWKRACELACETLKQVMGKPLWIGGNIPTPEVKDSDYFYQQAKKRAQEVVAITKTRNQSK